MTTTFKTWNEYLESVKRMVSDNARGHTWETDEDGEVDLFAYSNYIHNGPRCATCGYSFCHHCQELPNRACTQKA